MSTTCPSNTWWHLPTLGGDDTRGRRINASGVVAGGGTTAGGISEAATWAPPYNAVNKLPRVGFGTYAPGINDQGVTVGGTNRGRYTPAIDPTVERSTKHGYYSLTTPTEWATNGTPSTPAVLFSQAEAFAINDAGTIVGSSDASPV
ncbi:MAG TPA: hypothetical protein VE441_09570, partial [Mycobacterium sp.]|nr:hypothetical protein [Mycobacterium sp.]